MFNKEGEEIGTFATSAQRPVDIKFDSRNNCYVSDVNGGRILKYDTNRDLYVFNEKHHGQPLASPRGMYIHKDYLYVAERDSSQVLIFKTDGEFVGEFSVPDAMNDPSGIVADEDGFLFICDELYRGVFVF
jgi:sugar lactone lactonase YvrE